MPLRPIRFAAVIAWVLAGPLPTGAQQEPQPTILGVFNPVTPDSAWALGARAVRIIMPGAGLTGDPILEKLAGYKRKGFAVIVTVFHWSGEKGALLPAIDSPEWNIKLDQFEAFLRAAGPFIDYCTLDNEPTIALNAADFDPDAKGRIPAMEWYRTLAGRAQKVIGSDAKYSHMKVSSPALLNFSPQGEALDPFVKLLGWAASDTNVDVIDIHLHVAMLSDIENALAFMQGKTKKPIIITEWSEAGVATGWLASKVDPGFAAKWKVDAGLTNADFVKACYASPIGKAEWDEFVSNAPYDPAFMKSAFAVMVRYGVAVATYGAQQQYGAVHFDPKQLFATKTVVMGLDGKPQENGQFANWYRELATTYEAGAFPKP